MPANVQRLFSLTWAAAHRIPLHTLAKREGGHIGIGVYTLLHVAAPHALGAATSALAARCPQGTWCPALLGTVVRWELTKGHQSAKIKDFSMLIMKSGQHYTTWRKTQETGAICSVQSTVFKHLGKNGLSF